MGIDLSSLNSSISSFFNRYSTSDTKEKESNDVKEQIRNYASNLVNNRKSLADYMESVTGKDTFGTQTNNGIETKLLSAVSKMKSTNGMSPIEKYKYMMEQLQNTEKVDTTEPNAEKLLSESEKIIQKAMTQGISSSDTVNLNRALTAKRIALSRLDMLG